MKMKSKHNPIIAGHRGNPVVVVENSMESFASAIDCGADMLETDIRVSKDGVLVLMHDASAERTTGVAKEIKDMTLAEIKELTLGDGYRVPTLEEFLAFCKPHEDLLIDLEIKSENNTPKDAEYLVDNVVKLCQAYNICDRIMINSFDFYVLKYLRDTYGDLFITHGYYPYTHMRHVDVENPEEYLDYACFWAKGDEAKAICETLQRLDIVPCTGSNTSEEAFCELTDYGCHIFTENDPRSAIAWRDK